MHDGIHLTNMAEKFISKAFSAAGSFYKAGDINKFNGGWRYFFGMIHFSQYIQPLIRNKDNTGIGFNRTKRVIFRLSTGVGYCIEKCAFADIWQSDNTQFHFLSGLLPSLSIIKTDILGNSLYRSVYAGSSFPNVLSCDKIIKILGM